jgi:hypothetical protein
MQWSYPVQAHWAVVKGAATWARREASGGYMSAVMALVSAGGGRQRWNTTQVDATGLSGPATYYFQKGRHDD